MPRPWRIDFSEFHPLDHRPFTTECGAYKGGTRQHLKLWWEYTFRPGVKHVIYIGLCPLGKHDYTKAQIHDPVGKTYSSVWLCPHCGAERARRRDDWDLPVEDGGEEKWWWTPWDD